MSVKHTVMMATMMKININNEKHEKKKNRSHAKSITNMVNPPMNKHWVSPIIDLCPKLRWWAPPGGYRSR